MVYHSLRGDCSCHYSSPRFAIDDFDSFRLPRLVFFHGTFATLVEGALVGHSHYLYRGACRTRGAPVKSMTLHWRSIITSFNWPRAVAIHGGVSGWEVQLLWNAVAFTHRRLAQIFDRGGRSFYCTRSECMGVLSPGTLQLE